MKTNKSPRRKGHKHPQQIKDKISASMRSHNKRLREKRTKELSKREYSNLDLCYLAGFIDADGWISIADNSRSQWEVKIMTMGIVNTNLNLLKWAKKTFGLGQIHLVHKRGTRHAGITARHDCYSWRLNGVYAEHLYGKIRKYLKIKKTIKGFGSLHKSNPSYSKDFVPHEL